MISSEESIDLLSGNELGIILYRNIHNKIPQLDFLRDIVKVLLKPSESPGKFLPLKTQDCVRYDRVDHNVVMGETQRRCGVCKKILNQCAQNVM